MTTIADIQSLVRASQGTWTLDPAGSSAEFHVKHFWGAITVHGRFERLAGEGTVAEDGTLTGAIRLDAASLDTKQKKRDQHLRAAEFSTSKATPPSPSPSNGSTRCHRAPRQPGTPRGRRAQPNHQSHDRGRTSPARRGHAARRSHRRPHRLWDDLEPPRYGRPPSPRHHHRPVHPGHNRSRSHTVPH